MWNSLLPLARVCPSGLIATELIPLECPVRVLTHLQICFRCEAGGVCDCDDDTLVDEGGGEGGLGVLCL